MTESDPITALLMVIAGFMAITQYQVKQLFSLLRTEIRELRREIRELVKK